jgi:EpsD family peptidyl-prolyl cis-trans isomerase
MRATPVKTVLAACLLATLAACSGGDKPAKAASQVAVKVNGDELSIHQVNAQLARLQGVPADKADLARKQVVDGLVDQRLLIQQAIDKKLDRDPDVLAAIEQSRAQILAQAYVQKTLGAQARPNEAEVRKYYEENPALFAQRRVYRLQELTTDLPVERADDLKAAVAAAKAMPEVATWLQKNRFQVAASSAVRGAEQLPMAQVAKINAMKDGQMDVFVADRKVTVLQVLTSQLQPVDETKATPVIEQFLTTRKREELARSELKRLREGAKIEYVGDFEKLAKLTVPTVPVAASGVVPTAATTAAAPAAPAASSLDKGVTGLR